MQDERTYIFDYQPTIVSGDVSTETVEINNHHKIEQQFHVTASDGAVLEFNGFDIGHSDTPALVKFIQPSSTAKVYNKIINDEPTYIDFRGVESNGHVILINPSGFIFNFFGNSQGFNVAKLHAIAGIADADFDEYSLTGEIGDYSWNPAHSGEFLFAGTDVQGDGIGFYSDESLVVATGATFEDATLRLSNVDNSLAVPIDSEITVEGLGAVSDLAGQAVLQTGVMLASQTQFQPTTVAGTSSTSSSSSDGGNEESTEETAGDSSDESESKVNAEIVKSTVVGVAPFSQISEPILSVEASKILESALAPEVEQKMSEYLTP